MEFSTATNGEKEEFLKVKIDGTDDKIIEYLEKRILIKL